VDGREVEEITLGRWKSRVGDEGGVKSCLERREEYMGTVRDDGRLGESL
jgi:hypothetical protein